MIRNLALALGSLLAGLVLLEAALWLGGVQPALLREDPFLGFAASLPLFVPSADAGSELVTAPNKRNIFNLQRFAAAKSSGATRVFCVGGSTTYGRPYADRTSFCGWLRALLPLADPDRRWEVVNAGGVSYASYRVAAVMRELADHEPDVFVVYSGHNEFLEERSYGGLRSASPVLVWLRIQLNRTRTYTALREVLGRDVHDMRDVLPAEVDALLDQSIGPSSYERDDALQRDVFAHYRLNLRRMVAIGRAAGAAVLLVVPASKLRDCAPFKSEPGPGLSASDLRQVERLLKQADAARRAGSHEAALDAAEAAVALDPRQARSHFLRARILDALGRRDEARVSYVRSRDEDICPLRALTDIEAAVAEVAREMDVPLVDFAERVRERSPDGIRGEDLFVDHVHPTIAGHRLLALAVIETLAARGLLDLSRRWSEASADAVTRDLEAELDRSYHGRAFANLSRVLGWAGKQEEAQRAALRAIELTPEAADAHHLAGVSAFRLGLREEALAHYREALRLDPRNAHTRNNLGHTLAEMGLVDEAIPHYRAALRADPELGAAHYNLGRALAGRDAAAAIRHLERALELRPDWPRARLQLERLRQARRRARSTPPRSAGTHPRRSRRTPGRSDRRRRRAAAPTSARR